MDSPLTQQARPETFEPKVVGLYKRLFTEVDEDEKPEGFWTELFLLRPDLPRLKNILNDTDTDILLHNQHQCRQLLIHAIAALKLGLSPTDEHALDTLSVFFAVTLAKRYTSPSAEIIELLAGLDSIDAVFSELVASFDAVIRDESRDLNVRSKAVRAATAVVSGGYQTALVSYFNNRDLFPALMRLLQQSAPTGNAAEPLLLTGLLANYGKFESHNQYRVRFSDFVNDEVIAEIVKTIGSTSKTMREHYLQIQDDTPAGWTVAGTLSYIGLSALAGAKSTAPTLTEEQKRDLFVQQPHATAALLLTMYDFVHANKMFCRRLVEQPAADKMGEPPMSEYLSFTSYLYQHAYRSNRASMYAFLTLLMLLVLVEDTIIAKMLCETVAPVRLCRQRPPLLPLPKTANRPYAATTLDILADGLNHNLRKRLDVKLYVQMLTVISRLVAYLAKTRTKLDYHWSEMWRSLLSFVRFLNQYAEDIRGIIGVDEMVAALVDTLASALTHGEAFLPHASAYDDLFYKLVESGDALAQLKSTYKLGTGLDVKQRAGIDTLIGVSQHYKGLIETQRAKKEHLSPSEVNNIIKQGYDTLTIEARDGNADEVQGFREADYKPELKKIIRAAVADAVTVVSKTQR